MNLNPRKTTALLINLAMAAEQIFNPLRGTRGLVHDLYYSYFADLGLPFAFYFLFCISDDKIPFVRPWWVKCAIVFAAASAAEILQFFGVYALGVTFDPLDIAAYGAGVLFAAALERALFRSSPA